MFETLAPYQGEVCSSLTAQIREGKLSQSNLFGGPRYSLRMSTALELARVLCCPNHNSDACRCDSCMAFRSLSVDNVIIASQRDHKSVIETSLSNFERLRTDFSKNFLIRATRICLMQYHAALLASATSTQNAVYDSASAVDELLRALEKRKTAIDGKEAKKIASDLRQAMKSLYGNEKKDTSISIAQIRAIDDWTRQTSAKEEKRFVIIENVEDANVSARNSLLKILEEPPEDVYFFLLSEHPARILPTILSRVRKFSFVPLSPSQVNSLLSDFFLPSPVSDFESFFLQGSGLDIIGTRQLALRVFTSITTHTYLSKEYDDALLALELPSSVRYFLEQLMSLIEQAFLQQKINTNYAKRLSGLISSSFSQAYLYNQNSKLLLQTLYLRLMEERIE